jgi:hypothetical protein
MGKKDALMKILYYRVALKKNPICMAGASVSLLL